MGDVDYELARSDRGGTTQIYHLNLLKAWREAEPVSLVTAIAERDELGPEVPKSANPASLLCGNQLSLSQRADIHSNTWAEHVRQVAEVLESLRQAGLTANPRKCAVGRREVRYLGYHLGGGQVRPQVDKTAAIAACPRPKTKKEVRRFLGLAGYYWRFIPNFAALTAP